VRDNVTLYVAPTQFLKEWLAGAGLPAERIVVMPNMAAVPGRPTDSADGAYVAYAGRISREKGVDTLVSAATETKLPVRLAGRRSAMRDCAADVPANVEFVGWLDGPRLDSFYRGARLLVLPSTWFEVSPLVIAEAMSFGLPVVASRIGGIPEMVEDGVTGLLFEPGNVTDLSEKLTRLWHDPALCREMGRAGREKAVREYSTGVYYQRLMTLYQTAMAMGGHTQ
jgi:glycosyltransferase involved in cell wall biosynthesis